MSDITGKSRFAVIDSDFRRRASVTQDLTRIGSHVEPFENANAMTAYCREGIVLLVCDEERSVELALDNQARMGTSGPVIAYAEDVDARRISDAFHLGISDYLPWPIELEHLQNRLGRVLRSSLELIERKRMGARALERMRRLSPREREVLDCLSQGGSNKLIARQLGISTRTVEIHRANLLAKLAANNAIEAVKIKYDSEYGEVGAVGQQESAR